MNRPKISIVTVVLNGAEHLEQCMQSVLGQDYPNLEYIVVDGGSSDGTLDVIRKYETRLARWISESDQGISDGFNKGIALCTGEIIGLVNADDWLEDNALSEVGSMGESADVIYGKLRQWREDGSAYVLDARDDLLIDKMTLNHPATFVRKSVYDELGGFRLDYRIAMDFELLLRAKVAGKSFAKCEAVLCNMRTAGASDTRWMLGVKEVKRAKDAHLGRHFAHQVDLWRHALQTSVSKALLGSPLSGLFSSYRSRFATVKKERA